MFQFKNFRKYSPGVYFLIFALVFLIAFAVSDGLGRKAEIGRNYIELNNKDFVLGNASAPVTIIEYSDFQCFTCVIFTREVFPLLKAEYIDSGKVKFVYRDFILYGNNSVQASNAARCAGEQGKFWEYHDLIFSKKSPQRGAPLLSVENLKSYGAELNLDHNRFEECVDSTKYKEVVEMHNRQGRALGVLALPSFFINDIGPVSGSLRYTHFKPLVEAVLKAAR